MKNACSKSCASLSPSWGTSRPFVRPAPASHLDRDLGLGSLERVELLLRLEKSFGTRLDEEVLAGAETVQDLIAALGAANGARLPDGQAPLPSARVRKPPCARPKFPFLARRKEFPPRKRFRKCCGIAGARTRLERT